MADIKDIVKVAVDAYKGNVEKYSVKQSQELLYKALVEANNGNTTLNYRDIRDGKCSGLFTLIETILSQTVAEGLQENDFFNALVDFRNVALGDSPEFIVEDSTLFVVADVAEGTQGIRRQRLSGESVATIPTTMKMVRIYEELNRVLAGRVDFNTFIQKVAESFKQKLLNDTYTLWDGATAAQLGATYALSGSYVEANLLDLVAHVEAASGQAATIIGTKSAVRHLNVTNPSINMSEAAKSDLYNMGYYGNFYGTPVVGIPQRHKVGTTQFALNDNQLIVVAAGVKPIKCVYEGDPIILMGDPMTNADFTQEYLYGERYGLGLILAGGTDGGMNEGIGKYDVTSW
ncbi:MAG: hypothetical protein MJ236_02545 [Clostridia bacterium]|nr:hypothetical protein [Clostridia bacterium]